MTVSEYNSCVDQHADALYRFILKHIRDRDVAKDIIQDTYEKLWRKVSDVESVNAKSYMFTTAYRTLIDHTRREKKRGDLREADEPFTDKPFNNLKETLNRALDRLPDVQKSVIMLRDYEGYDYAEIGRITGLNESQVKVYIFRARTFLKNYIGKLETVI